MKSIEEQCAGLGYTMSELLGRTAGQVRALGFEIPTDIVDGRTLVQTDDEQVYVGIIGRATGYAWRR